MAKGLATTPDDVRVSFAVVLFIYILLYSYLLFCSRLYCDHILSSATLSLSSSLAVPPSAISPRLTRY
jgi:hypothetical protein